MTSSSKKTSSPAAWSQLRSCAKTCGRNAGQEELSKSENREISLGDEPTRQWMSQGNLPATADYEYLYVELLRRLQADVGSHGYRSLHESLTDELDPGRLEELEGAFEEGYLSVWQEYWHSKEARGHRLVRGLEAYLQSLSTPFGASDSVPPYEEARQAPAFKDLLEEADLLPRAHLLSIVRENGTNLYTNWTRYGREDVERHLAAELLAARADCSHEILQDLMADEDEKV